MNTTSILTQAQAEAVYSAMCALNNVCGTIGEISMPAHRVKGRVAVSEATSGEIAVRHLEFAGNPVEQCVTEERYADQNAFAAAYGLDHGGEPQSAAAY